MVLKNEKQRISERIKAARLEARLSSVKVSQEMKLSDSMCSQWERGISNPSTAHLVRLAEVLQVSFEWLATGNECVGVKGKDIEMKGSNTQLLKINELLSKTNAKQRGYLLALLKDIVNGIAKKP